MAEAGITAVYSIDPGRPFVDDLARAVLAESEGDPLRLADYRILLPTRRAVRSLQEAFLRASDGQALVLPAMTPLGDIDEDEALLAGDEMDGGALDLLPAISGLRRQLLLARAVLQHRGGDIGPDQALGLAQELARLLDQLASDRRTIGDLERITADPDLTHEVAAHWQSTLDFLSILKTQWPDILASLGVMDPADRRNAVIDAQAERWRNQLPTTPVIAAGSTGSIKATADFLAVIADLPGGRVVLPGLDRHMSNEAWDVLAPSHPQYGLKQLLERLDTARSDVRSWPQSDDPTVSARAAVMSAALMPAPASATPPDRSRLPDTAADGFERIDCDGPEQEADAVALVLREALEVPERTAALITPDRTLAERVAGQLLRWDIAIDDSAGRPLGLSAPGAFLRLLADAVADDFGPVSTLAVLKHPLCALGQPPHRVRRAARRLERKALRGLRPPPGISGLRRTWDVRGDGDADVETVLDALDAAANSMHAALGTGDLAALVRAHTAFAEACATSDADSGTHRLWRGDAGEALATFLNELEDAAPAMDGTAACTAAAYARLFDRLIAPRAVRPRHGRHPRLFIWGLLEARLQSADVMVLAGLNEGIWPKEPETGPWLSRPMMARLGLEPPERRLGLTAHDFVQAVCHPRVVVTRAAREAGAQTVPARWLQRLDTLVRGTALAGGFAPQRRVTDWARALDAPGPSRRIAPPAPKPPVDARPTGLSVTRVETWVRDPYAIYAERILDLAVLDPLDMEPGPRERGTLIHDILETFTRAHPAEIPDNAEALLIAIGRDAFAPWFEIPGVRAFWWPRFESLAAWLVAEERARRAAGQVPAVIEEWAEFDLVLGGGAAFTLSAKADRIDHLPAGGYAIVDYKTGAPPSNPQVESHLSPQLSLEAFLATMGAFDTIPKGSRIDALYYVRVSGGIDPGEWRAVKLKDHDVSSLAAEAADGVRRYAKAFRNPDTPYRSRPRVQFLSLYGDYDHLARVLEWSIVGDGGDP